MSSSRAPRSTLRWLEAWGSRLRARGLRLAAWGLGLTLTAGCGPETTGPVPTYHTDIAPIVSAHCATCHRPGQGAPFSLLSYDDVRSRADEIADATGVRKMPPWLPDQGAFTFVGERRLTPAHIDTIRRWAEAGAPEGDPQTRPPARGADGTWELGTPDLVLTPAKPYGLVAGGDDVFRNVVIPTSLDRDRFVRAVEFRPGAAPVHHAVLHLDRSTGSRTRDGSDGRPGFDGMGAPGTTEPDGHFIGWAPGRGPILSADRLPWRLARGTDLVIELHLIPGAQSIDVQPTIGLYFADPPGAAGTTMPLTFKMGSDAIDMPAGAIDYAITDRYVLPVDVDVLSLYPHAHFLGRDMQVTATRPDGSTETLLRIRRWSFHWQQDYRFATPVPLPRGSTLAMRFTYDNSDANPDNPHHPPVRVRAGQRSTDEMGNLLLQLLPRSPADRARILRDAAARQALANVAIAERLVAAEPDNAASQIFLGSSYVDAGRVADGIRHLELALRLDPASARAHNEMGGALLAANRVDDAVRFFRRAAALEPADARRHYNLARALSAANATDDAGASLRRALALDPDLAEAHDELGVWLFARGRVAEAIVHLRRAVALAPDWAIAHSDLGGALAQSGQVAEALTHLQRALALDPENAAAKENLARLTRK